MLSASFHIAIGFVIWTTARSKLTLDTSSADPPPINLDFEVLEAENTKKEHAVTGVKALGRAKESQRGPIGFKKLKPGFYIFEGDSSTKLTEGFSDSSTTGWGKAANDLREAVYYLSYKKLYEKIDGVVFYPGVLSYHGHEANVNVQIVMNKEGCEKPWRYLQSSNAYLRSYVSQMFERKICKPEFLNQVLSEESRRIDFSFKFELTENEQQPIELSRIQGNLLFFYRNVQKSKLEWNIGPIKGMGIVPAVSLDFFWLQEKWLEWAESKDSLAEFK